MTAGSIRVRLGGRGSAVSATLLMEADPGQVELGRMRFDLADDAELMAFRTFLRAMSRAGASVENRYGPVAVSDSMMETWTVDR